MEERDDPATRLKQAILACQSFGESQATDAAGTILQGALGSDSWASALGLLLRLLEDTRTGIRSLEGSITVEGYLVGIGPIDNWLGKINMGHRWDEQQDVDALALAALDACSDQIWSSRALRRIADEELTQWRDQARGILDDVVSSSSDLTPDLKQFLVASLRGIVDAIDNYNVTGSPRLADVVTAAEGRFAVDRPRPTSDPDHTLYQRFVRLCAGIIAATSAITSVAELPANLVDAYGHLIEEVQQVKELSSGPLGLPPGVDPGSG